MLFASKHPVLKIILIVVAVKNTMADVRRMGIHLPADRAP